MDEIRWPDDIPPSWAKLLKLGAQCLDEVNKIARAFPPSNRLEHELLEILRSQAFAIGTLSEELLRVRDEAINVPFVERQEATTWIYQRHRRLSR